MKKQFWLLVMMVILLGLLAACDDEAAMPPEDEAPTEVEAPDEAFEEEEALDEAPAEEEAFEEEEAMDEAPAEEEAAAVEPTTKGNVIPLECLEDDETFEACWNEGLISEDCFDDDGYLLDACLPDEAGGGESGEAGNAPPAPAPPGPDAVESGFDPTVNAFSFPNYGDETGAVDLTPAELQRMFGDQVCANLNNGCTLTPPARQWMQQMNEGMAQGHCEGMAVLSSLFYYDQMSPADFGGDLAAELAIDGNELLQREIAYWWVTQATWPGGAAKVNEAPSAVLDTLIESFSQGQAAEEWWALGIYKRDFTGGHAITPYAVEDQGDGIFHVYVYDNNYPGQGRVLIIDREAETWQYEASINPGVEADLYEGDAETQTLEVVAISPRLQLQEGNFEEAFMLDGKPMGLASPLLQGSDVVEIWLDGEANLLITAADGRRLGWLEDGTFVNEIDGATSNDLKFVVDVWDIAEEPVYLLPADITEFTITVDGSQLAETAAAEVTLIGPGFNMVVEELILDPGEQDFIDISLTSGDFFALSYYSEYADSPDIWFGLETDEADYEFVVRGTDIEPGGAFNVALDFPNGDFILNTSGQEEYGLYQLLVLRIDDEGEHVFGHDEIELLPDDTMYVNFFEWEGEDSPLYLDFDYESDGSLDETIELADEEDFYEDFYGDSE